MAKAISDTTAQIIAVMNQKGGCGKSTVSQHSAICLASQGKRVLFIDTDKQGTSIKFFELNHQAFPNGYDGVIDFISSTESEFVADIEEHGFNYDYIFIDTAPRLGQAMGEIISKSDLIIIAVQPKLKDIQATEDIVSAIKAHNINLVDDKKPINSAFLITRYKTGNNIDMALTELEQMQLPIFKTKMREYTIYDIADRKGLSVIHIDNAVNASQDIHQITNEITSLLN